MEYNKVILKIFLKAIFWGLLLIDTGGFLFLILGQVEGAKLKEAQLRNELKTHNIDISITQQVQFPSVCE